MATQSTTIAAGDLAVSAPVSIGGDAALAFVDRAVDEVAVRLPSVDREAMQLVLLLHRVTNAVVYDLESTVHRPVGWSWSAFRAVFTLWISGPLEPSRLAEQSGMSRQAVSSLAKTLETDGLVERRGADGDARSVVLSLTGRGHERIEEAFVAHNNREVEWASILEPSERTQLTGLLAKLASAAHEPWVNHRFAPREIRDDRRDNGGHREPTA
jgi:DNA-binding MarR family transcriptional regulator